MQRDTHFTKKKSAKGLFFQLLVYNSLFDSRTKTCSFEVETKQRQERQEAYDELYKRRSCEMRDAFWWRMAKYKKICACEYLNCIPEKEDIFSRDHLLGSEAARIVFNKFWKFSVSSTDETSLYVSYRFDAVITHAEDCFVDIDSNIGVPIKTHQNDPEKNLNVSNAVAPVIKSSDGGSIVHDSARKLERLLPVAVINLMDSCSNIFKSGAVKSGADTESNILFKTVGSRTAQLRNWDRELTITFKSYMSATIILL